MPEPMNQDEKRFCPFCYMQQFTVSEEAQGSVYCEVCGIDVPIKDLEKL
jgi:hypothetical protein